MPTYVFRLILKRDITEDELGVLFEAFNDDVLSSVIAGESRLSFERNASSMETAIREALLIVQSMELAVTRIEMEPDALSVAAA